MKIFAIAILALALVSNVNATTNPEFMVAIFNGDDKVHGSNAPLPDIHSVEVACACDYPGCGIQEGTIMYNGNTLVPGVSVTDSNGYPIQPDGVLPNMAGLTNWAEIKIVALTDGNSLVCNPPEYLTDASGCANGLKPEYQTGAGRIVKDSAEHLTGVGSSAACGQLTFEA